MHFEPGLRITDNIQLRERVGEGGMGEIWAAEHLLLRRPVAIKRLALELADNVAALQRFATEAQTGARMESPNVARVFDYAVLADGTPFLVMELLKGAALEAFIRDGQRLSLDETRQVVVQICAALTSIHDVGIVHRDVKPENIFLVRNKIGGFTAKLLDFGIAMTAGTQDCDDFPRSGGPVLGTPAYMSPEQLANASEVDARADLWSLAVVVYRCLIGRMPFRGDSLSALGLAVRGGHFDVPTKLGLELPRALDGWFRKALRTDRGGRFRTATEMADGFVEATTRKSPSVAAHGQERPHFESAVIPPQAQLRTVAPPRQHRTSSMDLPTTCLPPEPLDFTTGSRPRPTRVLVVEDEEAPREFLSMELHAAGFVVAQAANGELGLEEVAQFLPDVVVLDLMLPRLNGFDVARTARAIERKEKRSPMAIVAVTGLSSEPLRTEALAAGCDALLGKPIRAAQVVDQVRLLAPRRDAAPSHASR